MIMVETTEAPQPEGQAIYLSEKREIPGPL